MSNMDFILLLCVVGLVIDRIRLEGRLAFWHLDCECQRWRRWRLTDTQPLSIQTQRQEEQAHGGH